ncbi:hypothetical protein SF83666_b64790 (plasmid) [Sinorhizobium fredii CCBAU 83666]|nr:hypothetical protein SF83666_b64790 [Sinorhizobium fredii CCBAU 83666]
MACNVVGKLARPLQTKSTRRPRLSIFGKVAREARRVAGLGAP